MNLWRWNKGIQHDVVVQQSLPKGAPDWVKRCEVPRRKGGNIVHGMINDADTLRWLAQQNCVTPHVWNARCDKRDSPDRIVFDLDPTGDDFNQVRAGALAVAELLREYGLVPYAKVSGSRGIHIIAPLKRTNTRGRDPPGLAGARRPRRRRELRHADHRVAQGEARAAGSSSTSRATPTARPWSRRTRSVRCRAPRWRCR